MAHTTSRRSFFGVTAAVGAAMSTRPAPAQSRRIPTTELLRVGVMAVGEYSHMNSQGAIWAPVINPTEPERWPGRTTRMLITHCWDSRPDRTAEFAQRYNCEAVANYDDMVGKIDALITAGMYECKWWPQLTRPYLEAGIPTFINRPFALSMDAANEMAATARANNTPIMCTDAHEDLQAALVAKAKVRELLGSGERLLGASAATDAHEYPAHLLHSLYEVLGVFGLGVGAASLQSPSWWQTKTPANPNGPMDWGVLTLLYDGITVEGGRQDEPFAVTCQALGGNGRSRGTLRIYHSQGWDDFDHYIIRGDLINDRYHLQSKTIFNMQKMFETGEMQQSYEDILAKTRIFLAGFYSHIAREGRMVQVADVPDSWEAPSVYPDWIDDSMFG